MADIDKKTNLEEESSSFTRTYTKDDILEPLQDFVKAEIERLTNDKAQVDYSVHNVEKDLERLKQQSNMLNGAIQSANYFLDRIGREEKESA